MIKIELIKQGLFKIKDPNTKKEIVKFGSCKEIWCPTINIKTGLRRVILENTDRIDLEKQLDLVEGELMPSSPYWDSYSFIIPTDGTEINELVGFGKLFYLLFKQDPRVAFNENDIVPHKTEYLVTSKEAVANKKVSKRDQLMKAYSEFGKLNPIEIRNTLSIYGIGTVTETDLICNDMLAERLEQDPSRFLEIVKDPNFSLNLEISNLIDIGVLRKQSRAKDSPIIFGDDHLGTSLETTIKFLQKNTKILTSIRAAAKAAKSIKDK